MQPRDYIAIFAILIASVSLWFSIRTGSFNKRVKLAELRAAVLSKISEAALSAAKASRMNSELERMARRRGDEAILNRLPTEDIQGLIADINEFHKRISTQPIGTAMRTYEENFHKVVLLSDRTRAIEDRLEYVNAVYKDLMSVSDRDNPA